MKIAIAGGTGTVGRHVTELVSRLGHQPVVLSRSTGVDLVTGDGVSSALDGVDGVIDVVNTSTLSAQASTRFFGTATATLLKAEAAAGVRHHVTLSIVNADTVSAGYYAGKAVQEEAVKRGAVPWTLLRATQFHEFAAQTLERGSRGILTLVPVMRTQPVAAREVAQRLVELAVGPPRGQVPDLGGPREERLVDMVRDYARATRTRTRIVQFKLPGRMGTAMRDGTLLPAPNTERGAQSFAQWLDGIAHPKPTGQQP
ncbi:3-beta hydroxysteroid dehydrogenase [Cryobacterium zongtaii]|uniref:3-beta hydroxysteroid dehydrogenase n=1 Tax=Cryobacterium zongtaii TaxID=1259217 RepID=A0A2S3ZHY7_9MICO|nr:SDR family oxidoreductase [Cryobacterium zongtaii]POH67059.1 3-beta hydroxysteroid dehydrogenase [Cryobacterium zongtaii]